MRGLNHLTTAMKSILAPVDFSAVTPRVVDAAIKLARTLHARVVLLHVVPQPAAIRNVLPAVEDVRMRTKAVEHDAAKQLLELKRASRRRLRELEVLHLCGPAAKQIVAQARDQKAVYIVLGSHGHSALRDALVGSVAGAVIKTAPCPVLIVPPARAM